MSATPRRYVAVKRKAGDEPSAEWKRFKFVGSCNVGEKDQVKQFIINATPTLMEQEFDVEDYDEFVLKEKAASFPKRKEGL